MSAELRPVWLTRKQIQMVEDSLPFYLTSTSDQLQKCIVDAWEDAPTDPAAVIREHLAELSNANNELACKLGYLEETIYEAEEFEEEALAVLLALKMPEVSA